MSSNVLLSTTAVLLLATISACFLYYRRIRSLSKEYEKAREVVSDIVLGVDNQFRRQDDRVFFMVQKIEKTSLENKRVEKKVEEYERRLIDINSQLAEIPQIKEKFSEQFKDIKSEVEGIKAAQEKVLQKIVEIEKLKQDVYLPESKIEAAIPIKKEKALAPLTETELFVLETIRKEGEKTAPEIKETLGLTREHTARLMKKLYKDGYLERDTHKMPYIYRLKEEMQKILKKRETKAS